RRHQAAALRRGRRAGGAGDRGDRHTPGPPRPEPAAARAAGQGSALVGTVTEVGSSPLSPALPREGGGSIIDCRELSTREINTGIKRLSADGVAEIVRDHPAG